MNKLQIQSVDVDRAVNSLRIKLKKLKKGTSVIRTYKTQINVKNVKIRLYFDLSLNDEVAGILLCLEQNPSS